MIKIDQKNLETIKAFVKNAYPDECCGLLAGKAVGEKREVVEIHSLTNLNTERSKDRYEIDPAEYMKVDRDVFARKLDIIGIYHSHPDHPSKPSEFDAGRAWEGYSYLIVAIANGNEFDMKSWVFHDSTKTFEEEEIENG
ncbi:MAG: Mov34/MPN/PAD-1 family protein [Candidatus Anammoxibacter sp.]